MNLQLALVLLALVLSTVSASDYDVIIVGGGTAGCVAAATLTQNPEVSVLVLDIGYDDSDFLGKTPGFYDGIYRGGFQRWGEYVFSNDPLRQLQYLNPEILGGASSINGGVFQWPDASNLAAWNSSLWTFEETLYARQELENYLGLNVSGIRGTGGPLDINTFSPDELDQTLMAVMANVFQLGFDADLSDGTAEGVGSVPRNIGVDENGDGVRQDTYTQVLQPVLHRDNLVLVSGANVLALELNENGKNVVKYELNHQIYEVKADSEVILTLGVMQDPKFLLLNGIGPADELAALGIETVVDNAFVGKNFFYKALTSQIHVALIPTNFSKGHIAGAFYDYTDSRGLKNEIEIATFCSPSSLVPIPGASGCLGTLSQEGLTTRGSVGLVVNNPNVAADIKFNLYANPADAEAMIDAFKKLRATFQTIQAIEIAPGYGAVPLSATDGQILQYLLQVINLEHAVGTCKIGEVVDERLRLIDNAGTVIPGVRIMDSSVFPQCTTTHSAAATTVLVGRHGAELVKQDHDW